MHVYMYVMNPGLSRLTQMCMCMHIYICVCVCVCMYSEFSVCYACSAHGVAGRVRGAVVKINTSIYHILNGHVHGDTRLLILLSWPCMSYQMYVCMYVCMFVCIVLTHAHSCVCKRDNVFDYIHT